MDAVTEVGAEVDEFEVAVEPGSGGGAGDGAVGLEDGRMRCEEGELKRRFGASG